MKQGYPSLSDRIQSSFIDLLFIVTMMFVMSAVLERFENVADEWRIACFVLLFVLYEPLAISLGGTLGNYLKGIRVRKNLQEQKKISIVYSLLRYPIKLLLGWISFLTIGMDPKKRAIHDMMAGSVVIKIS